MKLRSLILVLALLAPSIASADAITVGGTWSSLSAIPSADPTRQPLELASFWSGASWDGWHRGISYLLEEYGVTGLEYLNDGSGNYTSFRFDDDVFGLTKIGGITSRTTGALSVRGDGALIYYDGYGPMMNSWDDPGQFALFRIVLPETVHYFLGVEDMPISQVTDHDYNDYVARFDTRPVPEPGTLLLIGSGMALLAVRRKVGARKARAQAAV